MAAGTSLGAALQVTVKYTTQVEEEKNAQQNGKLAQAPRGPPSVPPWPAWSMGMGDLQALTGSQRWGLG